MRFSKSKIRFCVRAKNQFYRILRGVVRTDRSNNKNEPPRRVVSWSLERRVRHYDMSILCAAIRAQSYTTLRVEEVIIVITVYTLYAYRVKRKIVLIIIYHRLYRGCSTNRIVIHVISYCILYRYHIILYRVIYKIYSLPPLNFFLFIIHLFKLWMLID